MMGDKTDAMSILIDQLTDLVDSSSKAKIIDQGNLENDVKKKTKVPKEKPKKNTRKNKTTKEIKKKNKYTKETIKNSEELKLNKEKDTAEIVKDSKLSKEIEKKEKTKLLTKKVNVSSSKINEQEINNKFCEQSKDNSKRVDSNESTKKVDLKKEGNGQLEVMKCPDCNYSSCNKYYLRQHLNMVHKIGQTKFCCNECNYSCKRKPFLKKHMDLHKKYNIFNCKICRDSYKNNVELIKEQITLFHQQHSNVYYCNYCANKYDKIEDLRVHVTHCHYHNEKSEELDDDHQLEINGTSNQILREPIKNFHCTLCFFTCDNQEDLGFHLTCYHPNEIKEKHTLENLFKQNKAYTCFKCNFKTHSLEIVITHFKDHCNNEKIMENLNKEHSYFKKIPNKILQLPQCVTRDQDGNYFCNLCKYQCEDDNLITSHLLKHNTSYENVSNISFDPRVLLNSNKAALEYNSAQLILSNSPVNSNQISTSSAYNVAEASTSTSYDPINGISQLLHEDPISQKTPNSQINPTINITPISQVNPITLITPTSQVNPTSQITPISQVKPISQITHNLQVNPITLVTPISLVKPIPSLSESIQISSQSIQTISNPFPTTSKSLPTSSKPIPTLSKPITTQSKPLQILSQYLPTLPNPIPTLSQSVLKFSQSIPTNCQPIPSVSKSIPKLSQPVQNVSQSKITQEVPLFRLLPTIFKSDEDTSPASNAPSPEQTPTPSITSSKSKIQIEVKSSNETSTLCCELFTEADILNQIPLDKHYQFLNNSYPTSNHHMPNIDGKVDRYIKIAPRPSSFDMHKLNFPQNKMELQVRTCEKMKSIFAPKKRNRWKSNKKKNDLKLSSQIDVDSTSESKNSKDSQIPEEQVSQEPNLIIPTVIYPTINSPSPDTVPSSHTDDERPTEEEIDDNPQVVSSINSTTASTISTTSTTPNQNTSSSFCSTTSISSISSSSYTSTSVISANSISTSTVCSTTTSSTTSISSDPTCTPPNTTTTATPTSVSSLTIDAINSNVKNVYSVDQLLMAAQTLADIQICQPPLPSTSHRPADASLSHITSTDEQSKLFPNIYTSRDKKTLAHKNGNQVTEEGTVHCELSRKKSSKLIEMENDEIKIKSEIPRMKNSNKKDSTGYINRNTVHDSKINIRLNNSKNLSQEASKVSKRKLINRIDKNSNDAIDTCKTKSNLPLRELDLHGKKINQLKDITTAITNQIDTSEISDGMCTPKKSDQLLKNVTKTPPDTVAATTPFQKQVMNSPPPAISSNSYILPLKKRKLSLEYALPREPVLRTRLNSSPSLTSSTLASPCSHLTELVVATPDSSNSSADNDKPTSSSRQLTMSSIPLLRKHYARQNNPLVDQDLLASCVDDDSPVGGRASFVAVEQTSTHRLSLPSVDANNAANRDNSTGRPFRADSFETQEFNCNVNSQVVKEQCFCEFCDYITDSERSLKSHMKRHMNDRKTTLRPLEQYNCNYCSYWSTHRPALKTHMWRHADKDQFDYTRLEDVIDGETTEVNEQPISNSFEKTEMHVQILVHRTLANTSFICTKCSFSCIRLGLMKSHMWRHSTQTFYIYKYIFRCIKCNLVNTDVALIKDHTCNVDVTSAIEDQENINPSLIEKE